MAPAPTPRTRHKRLPQRGSHDARRVHEVLDEGLVCHVAFADPAAGPTVVPTGYARDGDRLILHGSRASRLMQHLASGAPVCVAVTLLDGLVLARSSFHHSMNYRSVVAFGSARALEGDAAWEGLRSFMERVAPGRWDECRQPSIQEMAGTLVVEFPLGEASVKVREGPPKDEPEDMGLPAWSGTVPLRTVALPPEQDPTQAPRKAPPHVERWRPNLRG